MSHFNKQLHDIETAYFRPQSSEGQREATGYVHPHTKLKQDYEHLIKRTWQLFECGKKREGQLETAVVNAWKYFGEIAKSENIQFIHETAEAMKKVMAEVMESKNT